MIIMKIPEAPKNADLTITLKFFNGNVPDVKKGHFTPFLVILDDRSLVVLYWRYVKSLSSGQFEGYWAVPWGNKYSRPDRIIAFARIPSSDLK
jgi:hypothetical protein